MSLAETIAWSQIKNGKVILEYLEVSLLHEWINNTDEWKLLVKQYKSHDISTIARCIKRDYLAHEHK